MNHLSQTAGVRKTLLTLIGLVVGMLAALSALSQENKLASAKPDPPVCKEDDSYCCQDGWLVARLMQVTDGVQGNNNYIRLNVRLESINDQAVRLAYRTHSSTLVDEFGNTYTCCSTTGAVDVSVTGMGVDTNEGTDPQFTLEPGQTGNVTFLVRGPRSREHRSPYFH